MNADEFVDGPDSDEEVEKDVDESETDEPDEDTDETEEEETDEEEEDDLATKWAEDGTAYSTLDAKISAGLKKVAGDAAEVITHLHQMRELLATQGSRTDLKTKYGIPPKMGWQEYLTLKGTEFGKSLATMKRLLTVKHPLQLTAGDLVNHKQHGQGKVVETPTGKTVKVKFTKGDVACALDELKKAKAQAGGKKQERIDMQNATNAHYADAYFKIVELITNAPDDADTDKIYGMIREAILLDYEALDADEAQRINKHKFTKKERAKLNETNKLVEKINEMEKKAKETITHLGEIIEKYKQTLKAKDAEIKKLKAITKQAGKNANQPTNGHAAPASAPAPAESVIGWKSEIMSHYQIERTAVDQFHVLDTANPHLGHLTADGFKVLDKAQVYVSTLIRSDEEAARAAKVGT
jgi:uncharacterized protein YeaO (DUF488 family)